MGEVTRIAECCGLCAHWDRNAGPPGTAKPCAKGHSSHDPALAPEYRGLTVAEHVCRRDFKERGR